MLEPVEPLTCRRPRHLAASLALCECNLGAVRPITLTPTGNQISVLSLPKEGGSESSARVATPHAVIMQQRNALPVVISDERRKRFAHKPFGRRETHDARESVIV
jgi:hypothetical protein